MISRAAATSVALVVTLQLSGCSLGADFTSRTQDDDVPTQRSYSVVDTSTLVLPAAELLGLTDEYGTTTVVSDREGLPRLLQENYDRYPNYRSTAVRGGGYYFGVEVTRSEDPRGALSFMKDTDAEAFYRANNGSESSWVHVLAPATLSNSQIVCGSPGDSLNCERWTWRARYGQYVVRLDSEEGPSTLSMQEFRSLATKVAEDFVRRAPRN